jgi:hypothetical protein
MTSVARGGLKTPRNKGRGARDHACTDFTSGRKPRGFERGRYLKVLKECNLNNREIEQALGHPQW